jgi:hypothetical protein
MEPIKIEKISREDACNQCEYCTDRQLHLHYYIKAKTKKFKTFGDCIAHTRASMLEFTNNTNAQDFHSFNGGKSRKEFLSPNNVRDRAMIAWEEDTAPLSAESIICESLMDENINNIENNENFRGFIKK